MSDEAANQEKRSQEAADSARRFAVLLNGGALIVIAALAGALQKSWPLLAVPFFIVGLCCTAASVMLVKHRALKRRDAAKAGNPPSEFGFLMDSWTWDRAAFVFFVVGAIIGWAGAPAVFK